MLTYRDSSNTSKPYSLEISVANEEIELLINKNEAIENENEEYKNDIVTITNNVDALIEHINRINILMNSVITSSVELYNLSTSLTDSEMKQKLQISIEDN